MSEETNEEVIIPSSEEKTPFNPKEWQVVWKDPNEITPYAKNARKNDQTVPYLMNSIKRFGFKVPIVIDKNGIIVAGHTRNLAALNLGYTKVPCVLADDLTDAEIKAFRLADNKIQEMSGWDFTMLEEQLEELKVDFDEDMVDFGFGQGTNGNLDDFFEDDDGNGKEKKAKTIHCTCPECGHQFEQEA